MPKKKPVAAERSDPDDAPELTDAFFRRADLYDNGTLVRRGRPPTGRAKQVVSVRLDRDLVAALREQGPGWQTRMNETLRKFVGLS